MIRARIGEAHGAFSGDGARVVDRQQIRAGVYAAERAVHGQTIYCRKTSGTSIRYGGREELCADGLPGVIDGGGAPCVGVDDRPAGGIWRRWRPQKCARIKAGLNTEIDRITGSTQRADHLAEVVDGSRLGAREVQKRHGAPGCAIGDVG